jgi:hypothetical protein
VIVARIIEIDGLPDEPLAQDARIKIDEYSSAPLLQNDERLSCDRIELPVALSNDTAGAPSTSERESGLVLSNSIH